MIYNCGCVQIFEENEEEEENPIEEHLDKERKELYVGTRPT